MVVRGDGALVSSDVARDKPIETILSGPAASIAGASWLSGETDALVSDPPDGRENFEAPYQLDLNGLRFHYAGRSARENVAPALDGITLSVAPGETVGLTGPPGSGKTTLLQLIPRFYDPVAGSICINGDDLRTIRLAALRALHDSKEYEVFVQGLDELEETEREYYVGLTFTTASIQGTLIQGWRNFKGTYRDSLAPGEGVGYGHRWKAGAASRIGTASLGYGDGYPRHAPNGTPVLVNGRRVPLIGRVSMDLVTLDLRGQPDARPGDPVRLWGPDLPVAEVATAAGTIGYELLCRLTRRLRFEHLNWETAAP